MTQQIMLNRQSEKTNQLDMVKKHVKNAPLISEYKPIAADLIGLSWIFAGGCDEEEWNPYDWVNWNLIACVGIWTAQFPCHIEAAIAQTQERTRIWPRDAGCIQVAVALGCLRGGEDYEEIQKIQADKVWNLAKMQVEYFFIIF